MIRSDSHSATEQADMDLGSRIYASLQIYGEEGTQREAWTSVPNMKTSQADYPIEVTKPLHITALLHTI